MFRLIFSQFLLWKLFIVLVSCDYLTVNTKSGPVKGVPQKTFEHKKHYISYKGIPYAEPPIGNLRFKEPVPVEPWCKTFITTDKYPNSCMRIASSAFTQLTNATYSEDCLYLNVFTPVRKNKVEAKKDVIFYIHGGAFTEGDGSDKYYAPDSIIEHDVVLVTLNYRLGPFGFANLKKHGSTGNNGFKDQRLALKWIKRNIKYFGGDPDAITIMGQSAGAASVHMHLLGRSCKYINRAIMLSGSLFNYWAHYEKNNHLDLLRETFREELGDQHSDDDVYNFMLNTTTEKIVEKSPTFTMNNGLLELIWSAVVEDKRIASDPILTERPHDIYASKSFSHHCKHVEVLVGVTSAEWGILLDPTNLYSWIEPVKSHALIGLPYHGLTLTSNDAEYKEMQSKIFDHYFGEEEIEKTPERLNQYVQMGSDMHFLVPFYETMKLHSKVSPTFCYQFDISLNTNIIKVPRQLNMVEGTLHVEDIGYIFKCEEFSELYNQTLANWKHNVTNQRTIKAWRIVSELFTDFAKFGSLGNVKKFKSAKTAECVHITNTGLYVADIPKKRTMKKLWNKFRRRVRSRIDDEF